MHRLPQLAAVGLLGLFLSSGCTSGPRPQPISWKPVVGSAGNPPVVRPDGLVLEGQPIRTAAVYRGPVTVECDLVLLEANGATAGVTLVLVPAEGDPVQVPVDWGTAPLQLKAG
ncbi:MAG: hypothetical protein GWN32_17905, partial [Gemmatimonadetes bacterium]|nr:hypothetical protein [Gemmatimonadota bacterium]